MAIQSLKNSGSVKMRYTVTIMHGNEECTRNNSDTETVELGPGEVKAITVGGETIKSVSTTATPVS